MKKLLARLRRAASLAKFLYTNRKAEIALFSGVVALVSEVVRYLR